MAGGQSRIELLQGTLDFMILQTLRWGPQHGFGIAQMIRALERDITGRHRIALSALHRLEHVKRESGCLPVAGYARWIRVL